MYNIKKAKLHLSKSDPVMADLVVNYKMKPRLYHGNHFQALVESIISQQLSTKVADVISSRFIKLYKNKFPTPRQVLKTSVDKMRGIGLSNSKANFIYDLARHIEERKILLDTINTKEETEIIEHLTQVKGIGKWTAEMFMMFALEKPDVFSHGDLGLRNAIKKLYKLRTEPSQERIDKITKPWSPYKTLACRYLWASLDNK